MNPLEPRPLFEALDEWVALVDKAAALRENPLLLMCHPDQVWTTLAGARAAQDDVRRTDPFHADARPVTVCPRWGIPRGRVLVIDPLKATPPPLHLEVTRAGPYTVERYYS